MENLACRGGPVKRKSAARGDGGAGATRGPGATRRPGPRPEQSGGGASGWQAVAAGATDYASERGSVVCAVPS